MKKQSFLHGALILLIAGLLNRLIGFVYQLFVIRLIGTEGIGLFNMIFPVYILAIVIATAGIPLAVSKLVAEEITLGHNRTASRIFRLSISILVITSFVLTLTVYFIMPFLIKYVFVNPKVFLSFFFLLPGIFIVSVCSAFRGFFQGLQEMTPTAVTQILEQLVRVSTGLYLAYIWLPKGVEYAAAGLSVGVILGEFAGLILMILIYFKRRNSLKKAPLEKPPAYTSLVSKIFRLSLPITFGRVISTLILSLEAVLIPQRLQAAGYSMEKATDIYGQLSGVALTLLFIPTIITIALATTLIPAISDAQARKDQNLLISRATDAIRLTIVAGLPLLTVFYLFPEEISDILFNYPEAGDILKILTFGGIFLYLQQTSTGILQGLGRPALPLKNLITGSAIMLLLIYYLSALPSVAINGTAWAINICFIITGTLNLLNLKKLTGLRYNPFDLVLKPFISGLLMYVLMKLSFKFLITALPLEASLSASIALGFIVYFIALIITGAIKQKDFERLPFIGRKMMFIYNCLQKILG